MPTGKKTKAKKKGKPVPKTPAGKKGAPGSASVKKATAKKKSTKKVSKKKTIIKKKSPARKKSKASARANVERPSAKSDENDDLSESSPLSSLLYEAGLDDPSSEIDQADISYVEILVFSMVGKQYAFKVADVEEILQSQRMTLVPRTRDFVVGITTVRGKIIPVIDIEMLMEVSNQSVQHERGKIVVLKGPSGPVGIRMQRDMDIAFLPEDDIHPPPGHLVETDHAFIDGIIKLENDFVSILNTDKMLSVSAARGAYEGEA